MAPVPVLPSSELSSWFSVLALRPWTDPLDPLAFLLEKVRQMDKENKFEAQCPVFPNDRLDPPPIVPTCFECGNKEPGKAQLEETPETFICAMQQK